MVINGNTAVKLPNPGTNFPPYDILGRCVTPCTCNDKTTSSQVCGSDGRTYASACYADCAGVEVCTECMCVCNYMVRVCVCIYVGVCVYVCVYLCGCMCMCMCMSMCVFIWVCMCAYECVCCVCM